ncbi:hypothetical protein O3P69_001510 [Scylla paramamosain]|uniref:Uncharacterized protein n=1 Tax=Scylla paramamosain TaxID=85552 RepID=A0AAW0V0L4_SCYPA
MALTTAPARHATPTRAPPPPNRVLPSTSTAKQTSRVTCKCGGGSTAVIWLKSWHSANSPLECQALGGGRGREMEGNFCANNSPPPTLHDQPSSSSPLDKLPKRGTKDPSSSPHVAGVDINLLQRFTYFPPNNHGKTPRPETLRHRPKRRAGKFLLASKQHFAARPACRASQ